MSSASDGASHHYHLSIIPSTYVDSVVDGGTVLRDKPTLYNNYYYYTNDTNIAGIECVNNTANSNNNNGPRKPIEMKRENGKCPRFMNIFGSNVFGSCTAILQAKKFRSRRKADLQVGEKDTLSSADAYDTATSGGIFNFGATRKTGLTSCSKVGFAKMMRRCETGGAQTCINRVASIASGDVSVAESMDANDVEKICHLPERIDRNEWLATHTLILFDHINALCGTVSEVCTPVTCPTMNYPGSSKVNWVDERGKRHNYSAMRYIDSVMSFCEASRKNQQIFPTKFGMTFSQDFDAQCNRIIRMLWHCGGHLYYRHWDHICMLNLRAQYALVMTHLATIAKNFSTLDAKEMQALHATLHAARPPASNVEIETASNDTETKKQSNPRPSKRLNSCNVEDDESDSGVIALKSSDSASKATKAPLKIGSSSWFEHSPLAHLFVNYGTRDNDSNSKMPAQWTMCQQQQMRDSSYAVPMALKSGSWGGNSAIFETENTSAMLVENNTGANTTRSFKNFVQTY